ncbi:uncharacterized SAM-binding protein YcdF (DUF218 family) [Aminivibrio pyruvatiphilus]|jgi:uncharacterized SAM-binding protein YcdF (DUF218 family)|uniref:Uncharacterized SAM-binding protein YcdF (DUF218 family) n=2 Tax=Aminivibrio pyruvatiphilus TaxID=1005740 RepID=A0A4R8M8K3_9BACT|nr:uncharacterized SAM-binding protein YcdF (DUF218 family) [Aminivibrio pyruvatiphilus]
MTLSYLLYKTIGAFLTPPGIFVTAALLGGLYFCRKSERKGMSPSSFAFFFALFLYVFSIPLTARLLLMPLEEPYPLEIAGAEGKAPVVLVLAGGIWSADGSDTVFSMSPETLQRFVAGASAARKLGAPLLYSGGYPEKAADGRIEEMVRRTAEIIGFRGELLVEGRSRTTWENFLLSSEIIRERGFDEVILVTSGFHLRRSMNSAARFLGPEPVRPLSSGRLEGAGELIATDVLPSPSGLRNTSLALRELAGILAYELFGSLKGR